MNGKKAKELSMKLLEPYLIPDDCPYLSEDQRELSTLTPTGRVKWMAEWLQVALSIPEREEEDV